MRYIQIIILIFITHQTCAEEPVVTVSNGKVRGIAKTTQIQNTTFYVFMGIPYAAPPVGNLRFQPPQPAQNWDGILDATKSNDKICYLTDQDDERETEDCLYIHVFTPAKLDSNAQLPVLAFIHGGGFTHGHGAVSYYGPQFVLEHEVIYVSIQYRLGPFGFLSTGDSIIPGNMGLKDQQLALKWIQENIHAFGGNPDKVTIHGQSAGGASITYHLLNPGSAGLFRGAISNSGSALCNWAYQRDAVKTAYGIAEEIDPTFSDNKTHEELLEFLVSVDAKVIDNTGPKYHVFAPVIEVEHDGAFFTESMYVLADQGKVIKVPVMMGINSEEEIHRAANMTQWKESSAYLDKYPQKLVGEEMYVNESLKLTVGKKIKAIYTNDSLENNLAAGVKYYSDEAFARAIIKYAELQSHQSDVYFYQFSYHGEMGNDDVYVEGAGRVNHAEDQRYLWSYYSSLDDFPKEDILTLNRYVALHANFVKTLNPTPEPDELLQNITWAKMTTDNFYYLDIDENLSIQQNPREFSYKKWVDLFEEYARKPFISF